MHLKKRHLILFSHFFILIQSALDDNNSLDPEVLLEDPVAEEDDFDAARGRHGAGAQVGDGERAELLAVANDARHHRLQHLGRPPPGLGQEHLEVEYDHIGFFGVSADRDNLPI